MVVNNININSGNTGSYDKDDDYDLNELIDKENYSDNNLIVRMKYRHKN